MKKPILKTIALLTSFAIVACSQDIVVENTQTINDGDAINKICITGQDFQIDKDTRSSVTIGESGASFAWDEDDVIGIFPDKGDQVSFAMEQGAGTQTATFTGGGWALKSSAKYAAYYPHIYENRDLTAIPVSYAGQTQNGNANTDHIGAYDFMAASITTPENGAVAFDMQHLGALVQLTLTIPEPSTLTKVVLNSSTEFTETGTFDLTSETPALTTENKSNAIEIALYDVVTTEANENITVYFMTAPIDLSNEEITAIICLADETILYGEITGKDLQAGKAYRLFADKLSNEPNEPEGTIPNNQIWYTNGSTTEPIQFWSDIFGATIVSNTYNAKKQCWVVTCDGYVTTIGNSAFKNCSSLTSVTMPDSITTIGYSAFESCSSLTSVTIPDSVTTIGYSAFESCSSLTSVTIPDSVTTIGYSAFKSCSSLISAIIGYSVNKIEMYLFEDCSNLTSVTIGNSVTNIEFAAFRYCRNLTSITIPDSVTSIGDWVFYNCSNLTSVTIGDGVTSIGDYAFASCSSLTSVTIPDSVTTIGEDTFSNCWSLTSVTIPDSVTTIGEDAFYYCPSLTNVYITDLSAWCKIDFGNEYANPISYNSNLYLNNEFVTDIVIPNDITVIKSCTFSGFNSLTSVTIGDNVTTIGNTAFCACPNLTSVTIGNNVTTIGVEAFAYCGNLTSVTIGNSVTTIGDDAFASCSSLTSVTIPDSVTTIGSYAFYGCSCLTCVNIPDSVTEIGNLAFYSCDSLTSVTIPNSVMNIGYGAFSDCYYLTSFNGKFASEDGRCLIKDGVLTSFAIGCGLTEYTIPDSVTTIGDYAFASCSSLTSVTIPDSVTTIGEDAFSSCYSLASITIPDSVTTIGEDAFSNCWSLTSVTIPNSVTTIGFGAFHACLELTSVYCKATTPPAGSNSMFDSNASDRKIYVPTESVNSYRMAAYWGNYATAIVGYDF